MKKAIINHEKLPGALKKTRFWKLCVFYNNFRMIGANICDDFLNDDGEKLKVSQSDASETCGTRPWHRVAGVIDDKNIVETWSGVRAQSVV